VAKIRGLSENDIKLIESFISKVRTQERNTSGRPRADFDDHNQAPEVYLAKTPAGGISAVSGATAGSADCDIYHLIAGEILPVSTLFKAVYNIHTVDLPGNIWVVVNRLKGGSWVALATLVLDTGETGTGTGGSGSTDTDEKVKVSSDDTTAAYLDTKIVAGVGVRLAVLNDGANESLQIYLAGTGTGSEVDDDERVKVSSNDTVASYLVNKLVAGDNITLTEENDGGNETLRISWENPDTGTGTITEGDPLTVEAADGSPSYSGIRRLQFDEADGFAVSNPGIGIARIDKNIPCGNGSFYTYRYRCQAGNLNEYRQLVTLSFGSDKCLQSSTGAEEFIRTVACCDPACADEPGTSSGTMFGTSTGGEAALCCSVGPLVCVTLYRVRGSMLLNGIDIQLTYDSSVGYWRGWSNPISTCPTSSTGDFYIGFSMDCDPDTGQWYYNWIAVFVSLGSGEPPLSTIPDPTHPLSTVCSPAFRGEAIENFGAICTGETVGASQRAVFTEGVCPSDTGTGTGTNVVGGTGTGTGTATEVASGCCSGVAINKSLVLTPTGTSGDCSSASVTLTWTGGTTWTGTYNGSAMTLSCNAPGTSITDWKLSGCGFTNVPALISSTCSPAVSLTFSPIAPTCCTGTIGSFVVTE